MAFTGNSKNLADTKYGSLVLQNHLTCLADGSDRVAGVTQHNAALRTFRPLTITDVFSLCPLCQGETE
jgi:hypothetical protein